MKISLEALAVLDAIDRKGSFAAAATELFRVPSAISYTVQKLEQDLDIRIFDRSGYRPVLTPAGRELLETGRHLLQAVHDLESRTKRIATGWESELRIAVDTIFETQRFFPLFQQFLEQQPHTRLRISTESLGGAWDALMDNRTDLVIGAVGDAPVSEGYKMQPLMQLEMVYAVSPTHPLADYETELTEEQLRQYRIVAVADSSRLLPPRSFNVLEGQDVLTVADMETKIQAQIAGLGAGYLPRFRVQKYLDNGVLVEKHITGDVVAAKLYAVWRSDHQGKALQWFVENLKHFDLGDQKTKKSKLSSRKENSDVLS